MRPVLGVKRDDIKLAAQLLDLIEKAHPTIRVVSVDECSRQDELGNVHQLTITLEERL